VDNWDENEKQNLETVVHSLSLINLCRPVEVIGSPTHATINISGKVIDIIVVSGKTHEKCFKYAENYINSEHRIMIVIARDKIGKPWDPNWSSKITQPKDTNSDIKPKITEARFYPCGYSNLLAALNSTNKVEFESKVVELLGVLSEHII